MFAWPWGCWLSTAREPAVAVGVDAAPPASVDGPDAAKVATDGALPHVPDAAVWWSDRDLLPSEVVTSCPCKATDPTWCNVVDVFRATGGPRPRGPTWERC